jgi:hypothetical protein
MELDTTSPPLQPPINTTSRGKIPAADGRSREAIFRKRLRQALLGHLGGNATVTQTCLIDAAIEIASEIEAMKLRRDERGALSLHDTKAFLAYQNTYRRHLLALGIKGAPTPAPSIAEIMARSPKAGASA